MRRCVWSRNLIKNEEAMARVGLQRHRKKKKNSYKWRNDIENFPLWSNKLPFPIIRESTHSYITINWLQYQQHRKAIYSTRVRQKQYLINAANNDILYINICHA